MRASTGDFAATTALIAAIALFAGAFLIFNTLSMTVVERVRELGLLRAAGATRGQLTSYILVQAIGHRRRRARSSASRSGLLLAAGIAAWVRTVGSVPLGAPGRHRRSTRSPRCRIGLAVTLAAAIEPARRAGRISPVEALKARLDLPTARRARLRWLIAVFAARRRRRPADLAAWRRRRGARARVRSSTPSCSSSRSPCRSCCPAIARVAGLPFGLIARLEERLARASLLRDRGRAALTVGALTIGLAMIVALGGVGQHARAAAGAWIADVVPGDLVVTSIFPRGLDELEDVLVRCPASPRSARSRRSTWRSTASASTAPRWSARTSPPTAGCSFVAGDRAAALAALDAGGAVHRARRASPRATASRVGATIDATAADGSALPLRVVGIAERTLPGPTGESLIVGWPDAERLGRGRRRCLRRALQPVGDRRPSAPRSPTRPARSRSSRPRSAGSRAPSAQALDRVFGLFDALALVAVIVAALGIVNTLTMNVLERVREIGVLRAAGMTRRQVWRSVVVEAGITGLVGAICGVAAGLLIGGLMVVLAGGRLGGRDGRPVARGRRGVRAGRRPVDGRGGLPGAPRERRLDRPRRRLRVGPTGRVTAGLDAVGPGARLRASSTCPQHDRRTEPR